MKMTDDSRVLIVHDITLIWRRGGGGKWVAIMGPEDAVHFHQPPGCAWSARKPFALEPIATARTLDECVLKVKQQYEARLARTRARIQLILA